ncbi:hypothetical protein CW745_09115 [Psychromonas sp. psych-6C06]|uniref:AAA family ATPase n=1 Tax=Psychromonas sp. psych-6C06 TaxID=2058089 RepID=UPI000C31CEB8|nr:AAA family ATPase [Psychromonas sp. psych-6C06]PKF61486.1 hypothetical protein CW745_09115 [Psychromonas sp. psych-6C06]
MVERTLISFPSQLQLIERLQHLIYLSSSMVFISGEKGSGKSTLIEQLSNQLPHKTRQVFITLSETISIQQARLKIISQLFEQPLFDADDSLLNILVLLKKQQPADLARVVVIDNANWLPVEIVDELAQVIHQKALFTENEINFILVGEEPSNRSMVDRIKHLPELENVATLAFTLPPLIFSEAQKLLSHCLSQAGYVAKVQHQDALAKQLKNCQGIPEKILALASEISNGGIEDSNPSWLKQRFPALLLMVVMLAIAGGLAFVLYPQFIKKQVEFTEIVETQEVLLEDIPSIGISPDESSHSQLTEPLAGEWSAETSVVIDSELSVGIADNEERITIPESELLEIATSESLATIEKQDVEISEINIAPTDQVSDELLIFSDESESIKDEVKLDGSRSNEVNLKDELVTEEPLITVQPLNELITSSKDATTASKPDHQAIDNNFFTAKEQLLAVDENLYTLQLSGMSSYKSLQDFIKVHQLPQKDLYLYQTMRNGKKWYVVIYGQYQNVQAANRAAKQLPGTLSRLDSWAKRYASVHQDLN